RGRMGDAGAAARGVGAGEPTTRRQGRGAERVTPPGAGDAVRDRVVVVQSGGGREGRLSPRGGWDPPQDGWGCTHWLQSHGVDARLLRHGEVAAAAQRCVLALLEATAVGPDSFVAATGSAGLADA